MKSWPAMRAPGDVEVHHQPVPVEGSDAPAPDRFPESGEATTAASASVSASSNEQPTGLQIIEASSVSSGMTGVRHSEAAERDLHLEELGHDIDSFIDFLVDPQTTPCAGFTNEIGVHEHCCFNTIIPGDKAMARDGGRCIFCDPVAMGMHCQEASLRQQIAEDLRCIWEGHERLFDAAVARLPPEWVDDIVHKAMGLSLAEMAPPTPQGVPAPVTPEGEPAMEDDALLTDSDYPPLETVETSSDEDSSWARYRSLVVNPPESDDNESDDDEPSSMPGEGLAARDSDIAEE
eukprot:12153590-Karenia_brevis.AAC.1